MKIVHYADIQVKVREANLTQSFNDNLRNITSEVKKERPEIVVIAGDLFEFDEVNDAERVLIYQHIADILECDFVIELVIMLGNHDLPKEKKQLELNKDNNPIDTLYKILDDINPSLYKKVTYLKKQEPTVSKYSSKLWWLPYSLEDGNSKGSNIQNYFSELNSENTYISIHHDILKQYVDDSGLPVPKKVYDRLISIDDFVTDVILGGDIHEYYIRQNLDDLGAVIGKQNYFYPGSTFERNYGEGAYITLRRKLEVKPAARKCILLHEFDSTTFEYKGHIAIALDSYCNYITIDMNTTNVNDDWQQLLLDGLKQVKFGINQSFIKIKLSGAYLQLESVIKELINSYCNEHKHNDVTFELTYDKIVPKSNNSERIIELFKESENEHKGVLESEDELENGNVANLPQTSKELAEGFENIILSKEKLIKLFNIQLDLNKDSLIKLLGDAELYGETIEEIRTLFASELEFAFGASPSYRIEFDYIETTNFMQLTKNIIDLDIPGLIRITGTNGIGKTTLYNMIYWVIKGVLYETLKSSHKVQNTLLIFNDEQYDVDFATVRFAFKINGTPIQIIRQAHRTWKNKVTDEDKQSLEWRKHIGSVNSTVTVIVEHETKGRTERTGEEAEALIRNWFGDAPNNIMVLNQYKILTMLNKSSVELQEMVLDYIGIDYVKTLKNNLSNLKPNYVSKRPSRAKQLILNDIQSAKLLDTEGVEKLSKMNDDLSLSKIVYETHENEKDTINEKLHQLGDVPTKIKSLNIDKGKIEPLVTSFVKEEIKPIPIFDKEKPGELIIPDNGLTQLVSKKAELKLHIEQTDTKLSENKTLFYNNVTTNINKLTDAKQHKLNEISTKYREIIDTSNNLIKQNLVDIKLMLDENSNKLETINSEVSSLSNNGINLTNEKTQIEQSLDSGKCSECGTLLDSVSDDHRQELENKLANINMKIGNNSSALSAIKQAQQLINEYQSTLLFCLSGNFNQEYLKNLQQNFPDKEKLILIVTAICKLYDEITYAELKLKEIQSGVIDDEATKTFVDSINKKLVEFNSLKDNFLTINYGSEQMEAIVNLHPEILVIRELIDSFNEYKINLETTTNQIETIKDDQQKLVNDHQKLVNDYNQQFSVHNIEVQAIQTHNNLIQQTEIEYNKNKTLLDSLNNQIVIEESKLSEYTQLREDYNNKAAFMSEISNGLNTLNGEITELKLELSNNTNKIESLSQEYADYIQHQKDKAIFGLYEEIISRQFKDAVFAYYREYLNHTFSVLLSDMNFKLYWHENGNLFYVSYRNGKIVSRMVQTVSGMETCFLGLSLIYAISTLNVKHNLSHIFIDEISGQLNSGKELTNKKDIVNYQEQLLLLFNKFDTKTIFIVDHVIKDMFQTLTYEVQRDDEGKGSVYVKLDS